MTLLHDRLAALAGSVDIPPAPTLLDLEDHAVYARRTRSRLYAVATAAALALVVGVTAWWMRPDRAVEPAPAPGWSDLDVPYTQNGRLHWRQASVPVKGVVAVAPAKDVLFVWNQATITEVHPDGTTKRIADGVEGPVIADPDGSVVVWSTASGLKAYDATAGSLGSFDDSSRHGLIIPWAVSHGTVYASTGKRVLTWQASTGPSESSGSASGGPGTELVMDARGDWQLLGSKRGLRVVGRAGQQFPVDDSFQGFAFSPGLAHAAELGDEPMVFDLPTGRSSTIGLPSAVTPLEVRWVDDERLLIPVVESGESAEDPAVLWYLCPAPEWACTKLDVPSQYRSEIPFLATTWAWMSVATETTVTGESSVTSTSPAETSPEVSASEGATAP